MWKTVLFLLFTLIVVPICAYYLDEPPTGEQWAMLTPLFWTYIIASTYCFVLSTLVKNYSQVDKLWSTIPIAYAWIACAIGDYEPRMVLMAVLVSAWGIRLTLNFGRRGGYSWKFWAGDEDYRWEVLRERKEFQNPVLWMLFNLFFISFYQMGLILLFTLPIVKSSGGGPLNMFDWILAIVFVGFVVIETIADQQQWNFQKEKYRRIRKGEELGDVYGHGFIRSGLWSVVRHPNYASEQAIWIVFYCFSVIVTGSWINWSIVGCLLLIILFKGSSDFSEKISSGKYEGYKEYQRNVPRFVPFTKFGK